MKLISALLIVGMLAVSGWAEVEKIERYGPKLKKKAAAGDIKAQYDLGLCYLLRLGPDVSPDEAEALKWLTKAAEQGNVKAQYEVGCILYKSVGRYQKDGDVAYKEVFKEAVKWWTMAAKMVQAQCNLGLCYYHGTGVTQDYKEAVKWWTMAANQGNAESQFNLGFCYYEGKGVTEDEKEAAKWYGKALEQKFYGAVTRVDRCYEKTKVVYGDWNEKEHGDALLNAMF
jgi:TPR repeat protein